MKKIIPSILLAASASSSLLLAQNEKQATGCRLQVENRLKAEGYRLEMPLLRQKMEDRRWKMEVKDQGCSLQEVEDNAIISRGKDNDFDNQSSLLEPILERSSTPIFYLPSSISYLGVTPKLMMDPAELKNIENGTQAIGEALGIVEKEVGTTETAVVTGAGRSAIERSIASSNSSHQVL
ncbi:MAG TPA: hypothetical protein VJK54_05085, partial [Chthoniobacterales bacterium]|nr:hypothetical protein [Chthoniobacterales bacterium]